MPPRRRWQAVIAPHKNMRYTAIHSALYLARQPLTPPGCDLGDAHRRSPHVATTPRGEIRGYARLPSPPGIEITSPLQAGALPRSAPLTPITCAAKQRIAEATKWRARS